MNYERAGFWVQISTGLAVISGLALVVWELQQVKTISRAQLTSENIALMNEIHGYVSGESLAKALAKACIHPEELTLEEALVVENYYFANVNLVARMHTLADRDGIYPEGYWQVQIWSLSPIGSSRYGKAWFSQLDPAEWPPGLIDAGKEYMQSFESTRCNSEYQKRIAIVDA